MSPSRVAVITGAASGIGSALALKYASTGMNIVIGYHPADPHDPEATLHAVTKAGGHGVVHEVDVRDTKQVDAFAERALEEWGRLDIAVANAGILRRVPLEFLHDDVWNDLLDVDLTGVLRTFRSAAARMESSGSSMLAVSSIAGGVYGWGERAHYATAKAGIIGLVKSLAVELGPRGIRVNCIVPGTIDTPQARDQTNSLGPQGIQAQAAHLPLQRAGRAEDIANAIAFLTSEEASFITGTSLLVDGGMTAMLPK
ncbi:SDR family NAD(P)-dependent oxidoreductase [Pseudarthrobacter sp. YAF2]|uniref:SDR family NAD(P)-dependent oxidoreductase n=1 Tax=Pseudarthrobacter sp. YAF2 TaxID=3233078 RepID=UPI003F9560E0